MAAAAPNLVVPVGPQPTQVLVTYNITASAATGTVVTGSISAFGPFIGASASFQVPISEIWKWYRVSVVGSPAGPDGVISTFVNAVPQVIFPTLSSLNESNLSPFMMPMTVDWLPGSNIGSTLTLTEANGATAVTQVAKYWVVRAPYTGSKP